MPDRAMYREKIQNRGKKINVALGIGLAAPLVNTQVIFGIGINHPQFDTKSGKAAPERRGQDADTLKTPVEKRVTAYVF